MRNDMTTVVIERPRSLSRLSFHEVRHQGIGRGGRQDPGYDDALTKESMGRRHNLSRQRKELSDFLNPLWRFLRTRVGRPWNSVYSEIRENLNSSSTIHMHIMQHVQERVITTPLWTDDGKPASSKYNYGGRVTPLVSYSSTKPTFYVDKKGFLREAPQFRPERKTKPTEYHQVDDQHFYVRRGGVWYLVEVIPLTLVLARTLPPPKSQRNPWPSIYGSRFKPFVVNKIVKQLNSKEIRTLGL